MPILEIEGLRKEFLGLVALNNVDLRIEEGELAALIGPNGSGKTTLFNCVTGFLRTDGGSVRYRGRDITGMRPEKIALLGISRTFQLARVYPKLTLLDNLLLAVQQHQEEDLLGRLLLTKRVKDLEREAIKRAETILDFVELSHLRDAPASCLGYGQVKLFIFGMALMPDPEMLLLDEPSAATDPAMVTKMKDKMVELNKTGKTILFVEHDMKVVMDVARHIVVLDHGQKIAEGPPKAIQNDEGVIEAYFGKKSIRSVSASSAVTEGAC